MDNIIEILNTVNSINAHQHESSSPSIPEEILNQYPYGQFPTRYTKVGQEEIRRNSQNRFSHESKTTANTTSNNQSNDILSILPLLQLIASKNNQDTMKILSQFLFKDNKDMQKLFNLISHKNKPQSINADSNFPNTNKVKISSLKRI